MLTLSQLEQHLSKAAWILKGPVDAADFKVYFPFIDKIFKAYKELNRRIKVFLSLHSKKMAQMPKISKAMYDEEKIKQEKSSLKLIPDCSRRLSSKKRT